MHRFYIGFTGFIYVFIGFRETEKERERERDRETGTQKVICDSLEPICMDPVTGTSC